MAYIRLMRVDRRHNLSRNKRDGVYFSIKPTKSKWLCQPHRTGSTANIVLSNILEHSNLFYDPPRSCFRLLGFYDCINVCFLIRWGEFLRCGLCLHESFWVEKIRGWYYAACVGFVASIVAETIYWSSLTSVDQSLINSRLELCIMMEMLVNPACASIS